VSGVRFPSLRGRDLEFRARRIPEDLPGERRVVIVAFHQRHQRVVDAWIDALDGRGIPGLRLYEIPTIGLRWRWVRNAIDGGMATAIRDLAVRERTITVYTRLRPVVRALGLAGRGDVLVAALAPDGSILSSAIGEPTPERVDAIAGAL
jgi:hypothetical protein